MTKKRAGLLRSLATRAVIAALPVAMVSMYASGIFISPPRIASYDFAPVAEITVSPSTVGISTSPLYGQTLEQINQQLDEMQAIGVQNIRVFVPWGLVEQQPDVHYWNHIDDIMAAAAARNMGVLAEVNGTPLWAGPDPTSPGFPIGADTPNVEAFTDFMRDFVGRYGETVSAYEIWNEPNYVQFSNPIDPESYAALLAAVYPVIKELDGTATVVAGAVGATQNSPFTMDPVEFVQRMLAAGAGDFFDALSVHPYGEEIPYSGSCPSCPPTVLTPREQVEAIMGMLEGKKVWITEYGLPTTPGGPWTEADQAAYIKDLLDHWQSYGEDLVGPIFLYTGRDTPNPADPTNVHDYYGLWTKDGALKAAGQMLKDWLEAHQPEGPGEPEEPGQPQPQNPIQFLASVVQAIVHAITQAITNFFAQFTPPAPTAALVAETEDTPEAQSRLASAESVEDSSTALHASVTKGEGDASDTTDAETSETTKSEVADPELTEPELTEPVLTEPELTEPELTEPVLTEPEVTEPEVAEPEATEPDATESEPSAGTTPAPDSAAGTKPPADTTPSTGASDTAADSKSGDTDGAGKTDKPAKTEKPAKSDDTKAKPDRPSDSPRGSNGWNVKGNDSAVSTGSAVKSKVGSASSAVTVSSGAASESDSGSDE